MHSKLRDQFKIAGNSLQWHKAFFLLLLSAHIDSAYKNAGASQNMPAPAPAPGVSWTSYNS